MMEKSLLVNISVPETSEFSSCSDIIASDVGEMVIEESPVGAEVVQNTTDMEETSSSPFVSPFASPEAPAFAPAQGETMSSFYASETENVETGAATYAYAPSAEHGSPACEAEPEGDQALDETVEAEEERILDLTEGDEEIVDTDQEAEDYVEETEDPVEEIEHQSDVHSAEVDQTEDTVDHREDQAADRETEGKEDGTLDTVSGEEKEACVLAEEGQSGDLMAEEDSQADVEPDMLMQSVADEPAESSVLDDSASMPFQHGDLVAESEALSASVEKPAKAGRGTQKSKSAVRRKSSKEKSPKGRQKVVKVSKVSVPTVTVTAPVPTVTVTAPSDQSDDSEAGKSSAATPVVDPLLSGYPKRIENTDNLPPGWRRIAVMRLSGVYAGRYDITLFSEANVKMRSYPNVKSYLERTGQTDFLNNEQYDFKFKQPLYSPKGKRTTGISDSAKASKNKTPTKGSAKASRKKTPTSPSKKFSASDTPTTAKVCMTLKRKVPLGAEGSDSQSGELGSPGLSGIWEVKKPPKTKARKKTTLTAKKDSPQLKLDAFIAKFKASPVAKESKFKSSFKTVLCNTSSPKKSEIIGAADDLVTASGVDVDPCDMPPEKSMDKEVDFVDEVEKKQHRRKLVDSEGGVKETHPDRQVVDFGDEVEETHPDRQVVDFGDEVEETHPDRQVVDLGDEVEETQPDRVEVSDEDSAKGGEFVSDVYLAEEQEEPYKSDNDEESCAADENSEDTPMEMEGAGDEANKDALSEECPSEGASVFELKSEESDNSSVPTPTPESLPQDSVISNDTKTSDSATNKPLCTTVSRSTASKRSLSPSDSDVSARKRSRLWREADIEEDSSRSVGMCSDTSLPPQEEDENQNMATKVQKMHLSDSSSSKDMKDSASTSSSNCSSLPPTTSLLSPSWSKARVKGTKGSSASQSGRTIAVKKSLRASGTASAAIAAAEASQVIKTNGATGTVPHVKAHHDMSWNPPRSPFNLIQERLCHDPWKMLVATIFLHEVEAEVAIPLLWKFLNRWSSAEQVQAAETHHIARVLHPMERSEDCAATVVRFSEDYLTKDWKYPIELDGIQKYGNDSYRIFCIPEWNQVTPDDERLNSYCLWLRQNREELGVE